MATEQAAEVVIPAEILAAVDSGDVDEVKRLLQSAPEGLSKAKKKALEKDAQIKAKKLAKGGGAAAAPDQPASAAAKSPKPKDTPPPAPTAPKSAPPSNSTLGLAMPAERELVEDFLACAEALSLPAETLEALRTNAETFATALSPTVSSLRNDAYAKGFSARDGMSMAVMP